MNYPVLTKVVLFSVSSLKHENYRKNSHKVFSVLLVKENGLWTLPSGKLEKNESLEASAANHLYQQTNLKDFYIEQLYTFFDQERLLVTYLGLVDQNCFQNNDQNSSWFQISYQEKKDSFDVCLKNGTENIELQIKKELKAYSSDRFSYETVVHKGISKIDSKVIVSGISRLKNKIMYTDLVFNMMPELFTLKELQQVYEVILNQKLLDPAFRRIISSKVRKTDTILKEGGHRPSYLYRYDNHETKY